MSRRSRGSQTQVLVAQYFAANGWPYCTDAGAGRAGYDLLSVPGLAVEVKARREFRLVEWLRKTCRQAKPGDLPMVVHRPDGMGPATVEDWPLTLRLADGVRLLRDAGYGTPLDLSDPRFGVSGVDAVPEKPLREEHSGQHRQPQPDQRDAGRGAERDEQENDDRGEAEDQRENTHSREDTPG